MQWLYTEYMHPYPLILQYREAVYNDAKHKVQSNGCHDHKVGDIQKHPYRCYPKVSYQGNKLR